MNKLLMRYWFEAKFGRGVGVTAYNLEEAIALIKSEQIAMLCEPDFGSVTKNVDVSNLDQGHVIPNMGVCTVHGIWFPNLNS